MKDMDFILQWISPHTASDDCYSKCGISCFALFDSIDITFVDPRWVGAWWLGFVISVAGFVIIAVPLFGFPKRLPGEAII
jgi:hypothetical protein